jgi:transposase-like protein
MFIKTKFSLDVHLYHWINTTTPIDRMFREVRRRTNAIGCFENRKSLNKIFFFIINFINEILGNASFSKKLALTQF